jgi:hypothetical protein
MVTKKGSGAKKAKTKSSPAKNSAAKRSPGRRLPKAVPPPDNPLLRHQADEARLGGGADEVQMARARARALRLTKEMPTADESDDDGAPPADQE